MQSQTRFLFLLFAAAWLAFAGPGRAQTVVWSENFDDGNGNNRWYADAGVWQIGSPTTGPTTNAAGTRAYSGQFCATTGLTADYPTTMNSRLIRIQKFTVPATNLYPRLRFRHYYSFASSFWGADYGVVEVQVGSSGWQAISEQYAGSATDWSYTSLDLSAYAGQTVELAFHAVGGYGNAPGWYLDDISLLSGAPVMNNPETFERGQGEWAVEFGYWEFGTPNKSDGPLANALGAQAHGGTNCAATLLAGDYPDAVNSRLISPPFTLPPAAAAPYLRFWNWFNFGSSFWGTDYGVVEIQSGNGAWQTLSAEYTGDSLNWSWPFLDLTPYGGQTVRIAFHAFGEYGSGPGWYVDDVQIFPYLIPLSGPSVISAITSTNINESVLWQYTPVVNGSGYSFSLSNAPAGMTIDANLGTISWIPTQPQALTTYANITIVAAQFGTVVGSAAFSVTVNDVNSTPVLTLPAPPQYAYPTLMWTGTATAMDVDIRATNFTFALVAAPAGFTINATSGAMTWIPTTAQANTTNTILVSVTDTDVAAANNAHLSVTNSLVVIVKALTPPAFTLQPVDAVVSTGQPFSFTGLATGFPAPTYQWQLNGVSLAAATGTNYHLAAATAANLGVYTLIASNAAGVVTSAAASLSFLNLGLYAGLTIAGPAGTSYTIQATPAVGPANWVTLTNLVLGAQPYTYIDYSSATNSRRFYRAIPSP